MTAETGLRGLVGSNPLGFFAALGVQVALEFAGKPTVLWWVDTPQPYPSLSGEVELEAIAEAALGLASHWLAGPALANDVDNKLKLSRSEITDYLRRARAEGSAGALAQCLVAENSLDNQQRAKPSDLYFTAGQMKFLTMAREILGEITADELIADMTSPWRYTSKQPSLMWDVVDDRVYALRATDPSSEQKLSNSGAEALALMGLIRYPCFRSATGTATQGCAGRWKLGTFTWPLWDRPATPAIVKALLAHASAPEVGDADAQSNVNSYVGWGITKVMQTQIRRSDQGGYGTFGPARVLWQAPAPARVADGAVQVTADSAG